MNNHKFDHADWAKLTMFEQMGNIGSEVGRALKAKQSGDETRMTAAFYRGLDLIDATAELWVKQPGRLKELLRAREQFASAVNGQASGEGLEAYFMAFAFAARRPA